MLKAILGFCITICIIGVANFQREIPIEYVPVHTQSVEIVEVPQMIKETVIIEIEKEVPLKLRNFESENELKTWLSEHPVEYLGEDADCDDYALHMVERARDDGYDLHFQVWPCCVHAVCCAIIGNDIYFIESTTNEYEFKAKVD